jgi:DNA-binding XRE family transcriptional regulator
MRQWMKEMREKNGITQAQMGERLDISEAYYSYIESGDRQKNLDLTLAVKLSVIFGIPIQQIVEFERREA